MRERYALGFENSREGGGYDAGRAVLPPLLPHPLIYHFLIREKKKVACTLTSYGLEEWLDALIIFICSQSLRLNASHN